MIAVILGWLVLGERMDGWMMTGTAIVLAGVVIVNSEKTPGKARFHLGTVRVEKNVRGVKGDGVEWKMRGFLK